MMGCRRFRPRQQGAAALLSLGIVLVGCGGGGEDDTCTVGTTEGCDDGQMCEPVAGEDEPACFDPVRIHGIVFDSTDEGPIEGAHVVALDANGGARSEIAVSGAEGRYELPVSIRRDPDGNPMGEAVTLRASAADYQTFPKAPRTALPIDLDKAEPEEGEDGPWVIDNAATDIAMIPLEADTSGYGSIEGRVAHDDAGGVLVVAEQGGAAVSTAVSDRSGDFLLFNVPEGETEVRGYRAGLNVAPETVSVAGARVEDIVLDASDEDLTTVTGRVEIVDASGDPPTSVILVVESTFEEAFARGEAPAGLRAADVRSEFEIMDVPPGRYAVLAAFENDRLVRDPDEGIAGTDIVFIDVGGGGVHEIEQSFKVTGALEVVSPGAEGLEVITSAEPTFEWEDDSSEDGYELHVYDAYGERLLLEEALPSVTGSATVTYTWSDAALEPGMVYQFRVWSFRDSAARDMSYISSTEDLLGTFIYEPAD